MENEPKITGNVEQQEDPPKNLEQLVVEVDNAHTTCQDNPDSTNCDPELLHNDLTRTEVGKLFNEYCDEQILTFRDIDNTLEMVCGSLQGQMVLYDEESDLYKELETAYNLLKKRGDQVRFAARSYVGTLSRFYNISKQRFRLEPDDYKHRMEDIDRRRRRAHDGLIDTLKLYSSTIVKLREDEWIPIPVATWDFGIDLSQAAGRDEAAVVFSESILSNRDFIKDWAISAHLASQLSEIREVRENDAT